MARLPRPGTHEALLDAAREAFARRGVDRARVEDIARRAGISKGAFYLHFRTKQEAFREILQRFLGALHDHAVRRQEVEDRIAREEEAGRGSLAARLDAECAIDADLLELLWRNRDILAAVDGAEAVASEHLVADFRRGMRELVARRIAQRQAAGQLRPDVDAEVVADVVIGTYEGFARRMAHMKAKPDLPAWTRSFLVVVYEGTLDRGARLGPARAPARTPPSRRPSPEVE